MPRRGKETHYVGAGQWQGRGRTNADRGGIDRGGDHTSVRPGFRGENPKGDLADREEGGAPGETGGARFFRQRIRPGRRSGTQGRGMARKGSGDSARREAGSLGHPRGGGGDAGQAKGKTHEYSRVKGLAEPAGRL